MDDPHELVEMMLGVTLAAMLLVAALLLLVSKPAPAPEDVTPAAQRISLR